MKSIISWFVATPFLYHLLALSVLVGFSALALQRERLTGRRSSELLFLALAGLTMFVWRWPAMLWQQPLNIDEGQWAACALKTTYDLAPWRSFDGTTSGPLNSNILALPALFGGEITFFSTRLIGCGLLVIATIAFYLASKWTVGARVARLAVVPPVTFLALTWEWDFVHYASEYLPLCLLVVGTAAGTYLLASNRSPASRVAACVIAGLCLGSTGFAKLQALPVALLAFVFVLGVIILLPPHSPLSKRSETITTVAASLAVPIAMTVSLLITGDWDDAVISYIKSAVVHVATGSTVGFGFFFGTVATYTTFLVCTLMVMIAGLFALYGRWRFTRRSATLAICAAAFLLAALFVILAPRHAYPHYLFFSVFPLSYCMAAILHFTREANLWRGKETLVPAAIIVLFVVSALSHSLTSPNAFLGNMPTLLRSAGPEISSLLPLLKTDRHVKAIARHAPPGTRIAVWGWMPHYYVQTQTIMATRDAHTKPQLTPGPFQDYFRQRFLGEVQAHPPPVFVDAVAPGSFGYDDRASQGIESFPALFAFISENYLLKEEIRGVRVFVRKS